MQEPGAPAGPGAAEKTILPRTRRLIWTRRDSAILLALLAVAALLRFARLDQPPAIYFDETYYASDACLYLDLGQQPCRAPQATEQSYVHPPLGKWLLAAGIKALGFRPFGWRLVPALFGTLLVGLVFLLARALLRERWAAAVAGLLAATDFLLIVQSRIAMLDVLLAFFVVLGFLFLAVERRRVLQLHARLDAPVPRRLRREHEWRFAAGGAFGMAIAVKWSGVLALGAAGLLALAWSLGLWRHVRRRRAESEEPEAGGEERPRPPDTSSLPSLGRELAVTALAFGAVPLLVYVLSYAVWFIENGVDAGAFLDLQERMLRYHLTLKAPHQYRSHPLGWPVVLRPIAYYWRPEPKAVHVLAFGNPATWWASIAAGAWLAVRSLRRHRPERVVLAGWAFQYVPWLVVSRPLFFFYMTPVVPFMMIGLAAWLSALRDLGRPARVLVAAYLVIAAGLLVWYFYPVVAGVGLPSEQWQSRMWLRTWI